MEVRFGCGKTQVGFGFFGSEKFKHFQRVRQFLVSGLAGVVLATLEKGKARK